MKAITVSVQYADLLALTLPRNVKHFEEVVVVTSTADRATQRLVVELAQDGYPLTLHVTNAFYDRGCDFNKGAALHTAFDVARRSGWLCLLDADTVLPTDADLDSLEIGKLYCPRRRMCHDPTAWDGDPDADYGVLHEQDYGGYCHIFHAADPHLGQPWYPTDWKHAGGADTFFHQQWPAERKIRPFWTVLHLGDSYQNWHGRITPYLDGSLPDGIEQRIGKNQERLAARRAGYGFRKERL